METLQKLTELEKIIEKGLNTFYEVGSALNEIRKSKLYKETHSTFDDYCRERWGLTRDYAYKQIRASEVFDNVDNCIQNNLTELQARELSKVEPELQAEIYQSVIEKTDGKPTAKAIIAKYGKRIFIYSDVCK